jgi:hypothetical protein
MNLKPEPVVDVEPEPCVEPVVEVEPEPRPNVLSLIVSAARRNRTRGGDGGPAAS